MSEADPYAGARQTLRETVKWITTLVMGFLGVLVAGVTFSSLAKLGADDLLVGIACGAVAVICTLICLRILLGLLLSNNFGPANVAGNQGLKDAVKAAGVLPGQYATYDALQTEYEGRVDTYDKVLAARPPSQADINNAHANMVDAETALFHAVSYAAFHDLSNRIRGSLRTLAFLGLVAFGALGYLGYLIGRAGEAEGEKKIAVQVDPGAGWADYAAALARDCQEGPFRAAAKPDSPFDAWWLATLEAPGRCAGMTLSVPGDMVATPTAP